MTNRTKIILLAIFIALLVILKFYKEILLVIVVLLFAVVETFNGLSATISEYIIVYKNFLIIFMAIIAIIGLFFILKRFVKIKKIILFFLPIALVCALFIRIIPDYSNEYEISIVSLSNYNKYKQGYCLSENRILSKEERFKRGLREYIAKSFEANKMIDKYRCLEAKTGGFCGYLGYPPYGKNSLKVGYYKLLNVETDSIFKKISIKYDVNKTDAYKSLIFDTFDARLTDPKDYLQVNLKDMTAGFYKPFARYTGALRFYLYIDKSFILYSNFSFMPNTLFVNEGSRWSKFNYKLYRHLINRIDRPTNVIKIDTCGNVNFDIKRYYKKNKKSKGG